MKVRINNSRFLFFNNFAVSQNLDSVASAFSFVARFNPDNADHRLLFRPLSYPKIEVFTQDDILLLTGTIVKNDFNSTEAPQLVKLSGYSSAGVLEDCQIPYSAYPLESNNKSLKDIAENLLELFDLKLIVDASVSNEANAIYKKSVAQPGESVKSYISKLAAQRNVVVSHDERGNVIFFRPDGQGLPKLSLDATNTIDMKLSVNGQSLHSEISVLRQPSGENQNLSPVDTAKNESVQAFRPKVKTMSSGTDTETSKAADNALAAELQSVVLSVLIPRFEDIKPGDIVEVQNPEVFLFNKTRFMIKSLTYNESDNKTSMAMTLVLPESFNGQKPKNIFS
jgi:prophage tail gpP-like protein